MKKPTQVDCGDEVFVVCSLPQQRSLASQGQSLQAFLPPSGASGARSTLSSSLVNVISALPASALSSSASTASQNVAAALQAQVQQRQQQQTAACESLHDTPLISSVV